MSQSIELYDYTGPVRLRTIDGYGGINVIGQPEVPALLCADSVQKGWLLDCYEARTKHDVFFDDPQVEFVNFDDSHQAVIFSANENYSGSGATLLWTLLVLSKNGTWKDLLPADTGTSNQSDHLFWHLDALSKYGFFSTANYIWRKGEDHYGAHRYHIQTYEFCSKPGKYVLADEFDTRQKFDEGNETEPYIVVHPMLPEIQRRLRQRAAKACS